MSIRLTKCMLHGVKIVGLGMGLPGLVVTNDNLSEFLDTDDEWISSRTGIRQRHICKPEEDGLSLSIAASRVALGDLSPRNIDLILVATSTPEFLYPSTSCRLQAALGAVNACSFDLSAACSGFVFGLVTAAQFIQNGTYQNVLLVGVDVHSRFLDWKDRSVSILFGDAAGAVLLTRCDQRQNSLLAQSLHSDGSCGQELTLKAVSGGGYPHSLSSSFNQVVNMNGRKIYTFAVKTIPESITNALTSVGFSPSDLAYLVCHQANQRILDSIAERLVLSPDKCLSNIERYGNTSAASIPLLLAENHQKFKAEDLIAISGFGAGLTWGTVIWRW